MLREVTPVDLRPADASDVSKRGVFTQAVNENEVPVDAQAGMYKALDGMWDAVAKAAQARNERNAPPPPPELASRDDAGLATRSSSAEAASATPPRPRRAQAPGDIAALNAALNAALLLESPRDGAGPDVRS